MPENDKHHKSALKVNKGIDQPPAVNKDSIARFKQQKRKKHSVEEYVEGILSGDRIMLSKAITLLESRLPAHAAMAQEIIRRCLPKAGNSMRVGITGVPGVGKSTFIEAIGKKITNTGRKLAVLAIDPSSERSRGSILGDKTRMESLSADENAFIRPSPSTGSLGGVARKTRESLILCEAAGYNTIFIETVGVGQSEIAVHSMVDFFLLLMLAGAGDELQGIKRGIMEMADALVITKSDGANREKAQMAKAQYQNALHLFPPAASGWTPRVLTCSALSKTGIEEVWALMVEYFEFVRSNQYLRARRREQSRHWMYESINESLKNNFYNNPERKKQLAGLESRVLNGEISSFNAAKIMLDEYFQQTVNPQVVV